MIDNTAPSTTPDEEVQSAASLPSGGRRRPSDRWALPLGALAAGLVLGGAMGAGVVLGSSDPTQTEEYRALEGRLSDAEGRIVTLSDTAREASSRAREVQEEASQRQAALDQKAAEIAAREKAVTAVEQQVAANSIGTGIWTVGVDVEPGTYRVSEALTGYCYWAIYRSGTSGSDIVDNDGPTGGFPTVTLSAGQDFENSGCGTFVRQ